MDETWYTVEEISEMLKLNVETIRRNLQRGRLRGAKFGKVWRISNSDLQEFIDVAKQEPNSTKGTARAVLKHFGKWSGDDAEEIIELIEETRVAAEF